MTTILIYNESNKVILEIPCQSASYHHISYAIRKYVVDLYRAFEFRGLVRYGDFKIPDTDISGHICINGFSGEFSIFYND